MTDKKEVQSSEVSLKYMAWNVKEMSENMKKLVTLLETLISNAKTPF